jgi:hypothetical protein
VLQSFTGRNACPMIIHKSLFQEIYKEGMAFGQRCRDELLKHRDDEKTDMDVTTKHLHVKGAGY